MPVIPRPLLLGSAMSLALLVPTPGYACSKRYFLSIRDPGLTHFIGTATNDTVHAGPGDVRFRVAPGHFGPARDRPIYGQVMEVERVGGRIAAHPGERMSRVVLVPWDYGSDCTPTPWARSTRWVEPGTRGLFMAARLRDSSHWVGGLPTFDVHTPEMAPYPQSSRIHSLPADSLLDAGQLLDLLELLPTSDELRTSAPEAVRPLLAWAEAYPDLARRPPARELLHETHDHLEHYRLRSMVPPLAGTYRLSVSLTGQPPRVFYLRTRARAAYRWDVRPEPTERDAFGEVRRAEGYYMRVSAALAADSLPMALDPWDPASREGYLGILENPESTRGGRRIWRGKLELDILASRFPADSALQRFRRDEFDRFSTRSRQGLPIETPARFTLDRNGSVWVQQTIDLGDGRVLSIRGERISRDVIPDPE